MKELTHIKEYLSTATGVEGSLLIVKKIFDTLIGEVDKALIPRSEAALFFGPADIPGSSIDIDLEVKDKLDVRLIGEGSEIYLDQDEYTNINIRPLKYGVGIRITREMMEDSKWNLLDHSVKKAGKRFAENENALVIAQLDTAANTVSGGAAVIISDLTTAMQHLDDADYTPTTVAIGMEVLNDFRNIDTFVEANKVGNTEMLQRGFLGVVYGLNVIKVSTNAGMTTTSAYVYDNTEAYMIGEKRTITVENFMLPIFDMQGAAITQRIAVKARRVAAIAKITSS